MSVDPEDGPRKSASSVTRGLAEISRTLLLAAIVFVGARTVVLPFEVEGASMTPNLHDHERVLVNRTVYFHFDLDRLINWIPGVSAGSDHDFYPFHQPQRGDVVVLNPPLTSPQPYIKRIVGLPGESIEFRDGYVYVNGQKLDEPYIKGAITDCRGVPYCKIDKIPDGYVYVLGDNRNNSQDSRVFGPVKIENIIGKAWFSNWPLTDVGIIPHYDYAK